MGSYLGSVVFSASVFFYSLGLIFAVVGYIGAWIEPRDNADLGITSVGVRTACFKNDYKFKSTIDSRNLQKEFNNCHDTTKTSEEFKEFPRKYVSPDWYRMIQDMHLAALILVFLIFILLMGFLIAYCTLKQQIKKRQRPSSTVLLSKASLGLWFILAAIAGIMLVVEPVIFFKNYEEENLDFFDTGLTRYKYGPGFAITIAGGVCLLIAAVLGFIVFFTVVRKMCRLGAGDARLVFTDEFDNLDANETEMERLSNDELEHTDDSKSASVTHKKAYPVAAPRKAVASTPEVDERSYQNIPKRRSEAPAAQEEDDQPHSYSNVPRARPQPQKRLSQHGAADKQHGYLPDYGQRQNQQRDPMAGNQSIAGESMASTNYPPSTHYSSHYSPHMGAREQYSDTESQRSGMRNKSIARSGDNSSRLTDNSNIPQPTVIQPGNAGSKANSRYASMY